MNNKYLSPESLQAIKECYQKINGDSDIGLVIFNTVCDFADKITKKDKEKIDVLPNLLALGDRLVMNNMVTGVVNFDLQYVLTLTNTDLKDHPEDSLQQLLNQHRFENVQSARCYYNLKLVEELIERSDYDDYKQYLRGDSGLVFKR